MCTCIFVRIDLCACMCFSVCKGVAFTIAVVPVVCTGVFSATSCLYFAYTETELRGEKFI